jgi:hypothetical protein
MEMEMEGGKDEEGAEVTIEASGIGTIRSPRYKFRLSANTDRRTPQMGFTLAESPFGCKSPPSPRQGFVSFVVMKQRGYSMSLVKIRNECARDTGGDPAHDD